VIRAFTTRRIFFWRSRTMHITLFHASSQRVHVRSRRQASSIVVAEAFGPAPREYEDVCLAESTLALFS